ncbi:MAG TPA: hypothetical protein VG326_04925 [Tepidisphaeraceae bacterium]|nr:hypothetical protein [Tepidisphaeraceae bacterium]
MAALGIGVATVASGCASDQPPTPERAQIPSTGQYDANPQVKPLPRPYAGDAGGFAPGYPAARQGLHGPDGGAVNDAPVWPVKPPATVAVPTPPPLSAASSGAGAAPVPSSQAATSPASSGATAP